MKNVLIYTECPLTTKRRIINALMSRQCATIPVDGKDTISTKHVKILCSTDEETIFSVGHYELIFNITVDNSFPDRLKHRTNNPIRYNPTIFEICDKVINLEQMAIIEAINHDLFQVEIKNVIFNPPATIVFWSDWDKTVVKAQDGDVFDPEKGLAMAISKKALGNKGNYCNELKKWLPRYDIGPDIAAASKIQFPILKPVTDNCKSCDPLCNSKVWTAYHRLINTLHNKKATKADFGAAMEEAIGYLGEALDD